MRANEFREQMWMMVHAISCGVSGFVEPFIDESEITRLQLMVLSGISCGKITTVKTMSEFLCLNQGNASTLCKKLEAMGYLERQRSAEDQRVVLLTITENGKEVLAGIEKKIEEAMMPVLEEMEEETLQIIRDGFKECMGLVEKLNQSRVELEMKNR
ncbi:MAG: MarR family transcriptional regulator [Lachnospiraceae bacterium]|nr:MarR family transcriptional regulator [Lachnospiraceae bacterium]